MSTSLNTKRTIIEILSTAFLVVLLFAIFKETERQMPGYKPAPVISSDTKHCISCHSEKGNGKVITEQWSVSKHAEVGVDELGNPAGVVDRTGSRPPGHVQTALGETEVLLQGMQGYGFMLDSGA